MARERASERVKERERGSVEEDSRGEILVRAERGRESRARVEDKVVEKEETRRTGEASSARCRRTDPTCVRIPAGRTDRPASLSFLLPCRVGDKRRRKRRRGKRDRSHSVPEVARGTTCLPRHRLRVRCRVRYVSDRRDYLANTLSHCNQSRRKWKLPSRRPAPRDTLRLTSLAGGWEGVDSEPIDRIINSVHKLAWLGGPSATFLRLVFCFQLRHPSCSDEIQAGGEKIGTG